ncbi:hypothetical protein LCGC14_3015560 [marine sediment metagenome]|uniref:DUF3850 domain-containing protein n=1 Tax=marine sediment metagenome TaxID=412755 RepID=A0A0F8WXC6_9ZZZZ
MNHELKTWPFYFDEVLLGLKPFEYRENDRGFQPGHTLRLREWNPDRKEYTGRNIHLLITKFWNSIPGLPENYCIMAIRFLRFWEDT